MPSVLQLLERLPLPSLRTYVSFSVMILGMAAFYAHQTVKTMINYDPDAQIEGEELYLPPELVNLTLPYGTDEHFLNLLFIMRVETWCIWALINSWFCLLILLGKIIQNIVFGELRVSEKEHLKDKFWNFLFYKFIFVFGVMNVQRMDEVVLWVAWFSILGFLHLLTLLSEDRFEYLSFEPDTPRFAHIKLMSLLLCILLACAAQQAACLWVYNTVGFTIFCFLVAESSLLLFKCLCVVTRYVSIQLWGMRVVEVWEARTVHVNSWLSYSVEGVLDARTVYVYYAEMVFELVAESLDFAYHLHQLLYGNIYLSMASLVMCINFNINFIVTW